MYMYVHIKVESGSGNVEDLGQMGHFFPRSYGHIDIQVKQISDLKTL